MLDLDKSMESLLQTKLHRFATCWKIARTDGVDLFFTDHDVKIDFDGDTYSPVGGFSTSARQNKSGLKVANLEISGMLNSTDIKYDDMRAERYIDAEVTENLVDWQHPWAGSFLKNLYWIAETQFTNETWNATLIGLSGWLQAPVGRYYDRLCPWELGDVDCAIDLALFTQTAVPITTATSRKLFTASSLTELTGIFDLGVVTFTSGTNNGIIREVKEYTTGGIIEMQLAFPFDTSIGDQFTISQGCQKRLIIDCKDKFANLINFGGFPFIPGTDRMLTTPDSK